MKLCRCEGKRSLNAFAFTTQTTHTHTHTHTGMHTSSIKALHSLLRLSIRKLSLGFRALAYRHLYEAFSAKCSKHGPAICIEFTGNDGGRGGRWLGEEGGRVWCWGNADNKYIRLNTRLFGNRWIYIPKKSKPARWVKPALCCGICELASTLCVFQRVRQREYTLTLRTIHS